MKRLMKKAKFFAADNLKSYEHNEDIYTEIFINPSDTELRDTCKYEPNLMVRMFLTQKGDLYAWNGGVMHHEVESMIKGSWEYIHIDYDGNSIMFTDIGPSDEFIKIVKSSENNFRACGILGSTPIHFGGYGSLGKLDNCKTLEDIYNL